MPNLKRDYNIQNMKGESLKHPLSHMVKNKDNFWKMEKKFPPKKKSMEKSI